jgi:pimeloyl-ACP methyl ester carboxylesterase
MGLIVLFPGWGTTKELYKSLEFEGYELLFIDHFDLNKVIKEIEGRKNGEVVFIGWSLGAMLALKYLKYFKVDKLVLLSPTLNFLENQPKIVVKKMFRDLNRDKLQTLLDFSRLNFYDQTKFKEYSTEYKDKLDQLNLEYLKKGLKFLLTEDLTMIGQVKGLSPLIITATEDQIIKPSKSKKVLDKFKNYHVYKLEKRGHNLIYESNKEVIEIIRGYLSD